MPPPSSALPGVSRLIAVATEQYPRYSEGDVIEVADGRLLCAVTRKAGAGDFAKGEIVGLVSSDAGLTWSDEPRVLQGLFADVVDVMSASLCRSPRGVHLFFLARGPKPTADTRVYQLLSADEGATWSQPIRVSQRGGYHVVNNARVIRTSRGRMIVPCAYVDGDIAKNFNAQRLYSIYSDDDGKTWHDSNDVALAGKALMEPGVAECADGSIYMTIRTALGFVYEARSRDGGATWADFGPTKLTSPAAPSTVFRQPGGDALWMFYINRPKGSWKQRNPLVLAVSNDHGKTWGEPRPIETDERHSYGYYSVTPLKHAVLLTYYDWEDRGQPGFHLTNLRARHIPRRWFASEVTPPVFRKSAAPVLSDGAGKLLSSNSGLIVDGDRWRLWYTAGSLGPRGQRYGIRSAESRDRGVTWERHDANPLPDEAGDVYHAAAHRLSDGRLALHAWATRAKDDLALYRFVSTDDGKTFRRDPDRPLMCHPKANAAVKEAAGHGRVSNDAHDVLLNPDGSWEYVAAALEPSPDPRTVIKHDNAPGVIRVIARATSPDGVAWSEPHVVIRPHFGPDEPWDTQLYGMQTFRHRGFYLGLLHVFHVQSQTIVPEWAWSHNGVNWGRTYVPAIALGDEGAFDTRMIVFGSLAISDGELVYLHTGYNARHNGFRKGEVTGAIGRAVIPLAELDAWLNTLPEP